METKKYTVNEYTFYKVDPNLLPNGISWRTGMYKGEWPKYHSLYIGQLLSLFGDADSLSQDNEALCNYAVAAEDKNGNVEYLEAYYGPSGPAIGGLEGSMDAVNELVELIKGAEPKDYEYCSVYGDLDASIKMGVKNGEPYYEWNMP